MKKILLALIILMLAGAAAQAQFFTPYLAKKGVETAVAEAQGSFDENAVLTAIGTAPSTIDVSGIPVENTFSLESGEASAWLYLFMNGSTPPEHAAYGVADMTFFGKTAISIPVGDLEGLEEYAINELAYDELMDSDEMVSTLNSSVADFKDFMNDNPEAKPDLITLFYNTINPDFPDDTPLWIISLTQDDQNLFCYMDAITGETECVTSTVGVEQLAESGGGMRVFPNPANGFAFVRIPESIWHTEGLVEIVDIFGNVYSGFPSFSSGSMEVIKLPVAGLPEGTYFVRYNTPKNVWSDKMIIAR